MSVILKGIFREMFIHGPDQAKNIQTNYIARLSMINKKERDLKQKIYICINQQLNMEYGRIFHSKKWVSICFGTEEPTTIGERSKYL